MTQITHGDRVDDLLLMIVEIQYKILWIIRMHFQWFVNDFAFAANFVLPEEIFVSINIPEYNVQEILWQGSCFDLKFRI